MKIIDLLNKIANNEEIPKKIKYDGSIYKFDNLQDDYMPNDNYNGLLDELCTFTALNDEVEIIEEDKKIEKMVYCEENTFKNMKECTYLSPEEKRLLDSNFKELGNKINEIIDYINRGD